MINSGKCAQKDNLLEKYNLIKNGQNIILSQGETIGLADCLYSDYQ